VLQKTTSFIGVKPLDVHQGTQTWMLIADWIPPKKTREYSFFLSFFNHSLPDIQSQAGVA